MKCLVLLIAIMGLLLTHSLFAQTAVNVSTGGTGWKRIATVAGQNGRGFGRVTVYTRGGGNFVPEFMHIDWFHNWSATGGMSVRTDSRPAGHPPHWTGARITSDESNIYIEVNFTKDIPSSSLSVMSDSYGWRPASLYTGTLPNGGGNIRATATLAKLNIGDGFVVTYDNNVGIGTVTPSEKLSVNGNIRAKEVKVETANWPDYVFEEDYTLPPLSELETYVKTNKHLPGIPSAKEARADGIGLAEMNRKLLEKLEELTLYVIEIKKENEEQESKIKQLMQQIDKN